MALERVTSFTIISELGTTHRVGQYRHRTKTTTMHNQGTHSYATGGPVTLKTDDGYNVKFLEKGKFEIITPRGSIQASSNDPLAYDGTN